MFKDCLFLFGLFARIGLFTIGGGYVMLPMLRRELVEKLGWVTDDDLLNYYAVGQSTPGIIAINTATFVGYRRAGIWGAISATMGMVFPSLVIIMIIAMTFNQFQDNIYVQKAFKGIRIAVATLLVFTVRDLIEKSAKDAISIVLIILSFGLVVGFDVSPIPVIVGAGLIGLLSAKYRGDSK